MSTGSNGGRSRFFTHRIRCMQRTPFTSELFARRYILQYAAAAADAAAHNQYREQYATNFEYTFMLFYFEIHTLCVCAGVCVRVCMMLRRYTMCESIFGRFICPTN